MTVRRTPPFRFSTFTRRGVKTLIHLIASGYLVLLFYAGIKGQLGPDPVETLLNETGIWAIHILIITLLLSPLAKWLPSPEPIKFRRLMGIYVFVYAFAHFSVYILFELQLDMALVLGELSKRPYIMVGMSALLLLFALTITSFQSIRRRMGRSWQRLHNLIYLILPLAVLHFTWSQKTFWQEPVFYWIVTAIILSMRLKGTRVFKRARVTLSGNSN